MSCKVLHITWSAHFGGIERLLYEIGQEQQKSSELEPTIFFPKPEGDMLALFEASGIPLEKGSFKSGLDLWPALYAETKKILSKYDVLHFHGFNPLIARAAAKLRKPIVYTEHGNFGFGRKRGRADQVLLKLRNRFFNRHVQKLIFNSTFTQDYAARCMKISPNVNQEMVYNGVAKKENGQEVERSLADWKDHFVIGTAARFAGFKRLHLLIEAFAQMEQKSAHLLMVGDGPLKVELEQKAIELGVSDRVRFTGYRSNVGAYIQAMNVFVVPSMNEPFGLTVIEVLGTGTPVLVMKDGGGARELVEQQNPRDVLDSKEDLAQRLDHYQDHPEDWKQGREERMKFAAQFSIEKHVNRLNEIYQEIRYVRN